MKKREEDLIKNKSLQILSILTIFIFIIFLLILDTTPKILSTENNTFNRLSNIFSNKSQQDLFSKQLLKLEERHKSQEVNYKKPLENIVAKSYVVYDIRNDKILYEKNANQVLPLASLTKVITAATAINLKNRDTEIIIKSSLMREDEKLDLGMFEGQVWKLEDLLKYGLTISSNSSMDIIASTITGSNQEFVSKMNDYVKSLGFKNFYFNSASGLDYGEIIGGKGTAIEFAKFFAKSYEFIPDILSYTINSKINILSDHQNLYQIPNTFREADKSVGLLASKTGFTDAAGGNLAIIFNYDINRPLVIVVLGSTPDGRFDDVKKIYEAITGIK